MIEAVEENNSINDGQWANWDDMADIEAVYGDLQDKDVSRQEAEAVISAAIASNGKTLADDLRKLGRQIYGQEFSGPSFWFRS
jgi:hypothetical protein